MKFDRIYIEITNICNFNCAFCSTSTRQKKSMTMQEFEAVLAEVKQYTSEVCLHVLGEPLLHPYVESIFELCAANELQINLVTNGFYLKDKQEVILKNSRLFKKINVSLHAYSALPNSSAKIEEILTVCKTLSDKGILIELRNLSINKDTAFIQTLSHAFNHVFSVQLQGSINQKIKGYLYYVVKKPFVWPDQSKNNALLSGEKSKGIYCLGLRSHIAVLSNLNVVPCCLDSSAHLLLGNLNQNTIQEILQTKRFKNMYNAFGAGFTYEKFCQTCEYNKNIKGK